MLPYVLIYAIDFMKPTSYSGGEIKREEEKVQERKREKKAINFLLFGKRERRLLKEHEVEKLFSWTPHIPNFSLKG